MPTNLIFLNKTLVPDAERHTIRVSNRPAMFGPALSTYRSLVDVAQ